MPFNNTKASNPPPTLLSRGTTMLAEEPLIVMSDGGCTPKDGLHLGILIDMHV